MHGHVNFKILCYMEFYVIQFTLGMSVMVKSKVPVHAIKTCTKSGGISPMIFNLGSRWKWVIVLTPRPIYSRGEKTFLQIT